MKVLVVYESMFGNTAAIALAVTHGLSERAEVELHDVSVAPLGDGFDLVVAGAPTHAFSLSRPASRQDAIKHGAAHGGAEVGLREWLGHLPRAGTDAQFVAFDTRVGRARRLPGSAAGKATRMARRLGFSVRKHESFLVHGTSGPLLTGELVRAESWGRLLAGAKTSRRAVVSD